MTPSCATCAFMIPQDDRPVCRKDGPSLLASTMPGMAPKAVYPPIEPDLLHIMCCHYWQERKQPPAPPNGEAPTPLTVQPDGFVGQAIESAVALIARSTVTEQQQAPPAPPIHLPDDPHDVALQKTVLDPIRCAGFVQDEPCPNLPTASTMFCESCLLLMAKTSAGMTQCCYRMNDGRRCPHRALKGRADCGNHGSPEPIAESVRKKSRRPTPEEQCIGRNNDSSQCKRFGAKKWGMYCGQCARHPKNADAILAICRAQGIEPPKVWPDGAPPGLKRRKR